VLMALSRDQARSRRKREVRSKVLTAPRGKRLREELANLRRSTMLLLGGEVCERPRTRGECRFGPRPCPYVSCRHHLFVEVQRTGNLKLNFPDLQPWEIPETCSLDVAERGGCTLEEVGDLMNMTRERVRQLEQDAFESVKDAPGSYLLLLMAEEVGIVGPQPELPLRRDEVVELEIEE
jgi:hypothetical protein